MSLKGSSDDVDKSSSSSNPTLDVNVPPTFDIQDVANADNVDTDFRLLDAAETLVNLQSMQEQQQQLFLTTSDVDLPMDFAAFDTSPPAPPNVTVVKKALMGPPPVPNKRLPTVPEHQMLPPMKPPPGRGRGRGRGSRGGRGGRTTTTSVDQQQQQQQLMQQPQVPQMSEESSQSEDGGDGEAAVAQAPEAVMKVGDLTLPGNIIEKFRLQQIMALMDDPEIEAAFKAHAHKIQAERRKKLEK